MDYLSEDEREEVEAEDTEGGVLQLSSQEDPPRPDDGQRHLWAPLTTSSASTLFILQQVLELLLMV